MSTGTTAGGRSGDLETTVNCMADLGSRNYWPQWRSIRSATLVVTGENGIFPPGHGDEMIAQLFQKRR